MASHRSRSPSLLDSVSSRSASPAERQRWGRSSSSSSQRASPRQSSTMSPRRDRRSRSRSGGRNPRDDRERSFGHHRGRHVFRGYHSKGERHREPHAQPHPRAAGQLDEASHPDLASQRGRASLPPQASLFAANVQAMRRAVSDGFADTAGPPRRKFDRKGPRRDVYSNRGRPYRSPGHQRQEFGDSFSFPRDQQDRDAEALRPRPLRAVTPPLDAARERERVSSSAVRPRPPLSIRDDVTTIAPPDSTISPVAVSVELGEFNSSGSTAEASLSHMGSSVFVKNLPDECNWDFVSQFFRSFNPTEVCYAVDGWRVSFESAERRDNVVDAFHGTAVHGSVISVVPWVALSSRPPPETPDLNLHSSEIADDAVGVEVPQPSKTIILAQLPTESVAPSTVEEVAPQQPALIDECVNVVCEALLHTVAEHAWRDVVEAPVFAFLEEWAGRPHVPKPRETINASDSSQRAPSLPDQPPGPSAPAVSGQPAIMPEPALSRKSTQASESGRHATPDVHPAKLRRTRSSSAPRADAPTVVDRPSASQTSSLPCGFCGASDDQDQMAICSSREAGMPSPGCTSALHIYCMQPPVRRIPRQWACDACEKFRSGAGDALSSAQPPPRGDSGADDQSSGSDGEPPDEISMARSRSQRRPSAAGQGGVVSPKHWRAGARKGSSQRSRDNPLSSDNADDTANSRKRDRFKYTQ
ncbi:RRM domain-containing protein [Plasmodiophora brassicae]|uniref:RRM domain-containing protein n=1 Tax=Plasmodiophora brassicae TaxID=37360 RepID=A0A0G4J549_PLABS|nr:hypothetical protein PBRA_002589 [Plasmodiophora brassicae]